MATRALNEVYSKEDVMTGQNQEPITQNAEPTATEPTQKTFTQEDVNRIVANRVAKYSDYEALKEKAAKFDEAEEAAKSDLQKATERANSLQAELDAMKSAEQLRKMREEVASDKGVPANLLTGSTKEECEAQAAAMIEWAKPTYPNVKDGGEPIGNSKKATRDQFAEWLNQQ